MTGDLADIWLVNLDAHLAGTQYNFILPGLTYPTSDTMEVDLKEANLFCNYDPDSHTLSVIPSIDLQGNSKVDVTLTSDHGVKVDLSFKIWISFINMGLYIPQIPIYGKEDPVGRRNINLPPINVGITDVSNTGLVRIEFNPPLTDEALNKTVTDDIVVTIRGNDEREIIKDMLEFDYSYVDVKVDHVLIQLDFNEPTYVTRDDYLIIYFHREIFNSTFFYTNNTELLEDIEEKNITRSMLDYDRVQKQMPA